MGNVAFDQGDLVRAITQFEAAMAQSQEADDQITSIWSLFNLGLAVAEQRDFVRALAIFEETLAQFYDLRIQPGMAQVRTRRECPPRPPRRQNFCAGVGGRVGALLEAGRRRGIRYSWLTWDSNLIARPTEGSPQTRQGQV